MGEKLYVSQFYTSDVWCECPKCGERIDGWLSDPSSETTACDYCKAVVHVTDEIDIDMY